MREEKILRNQKKKTHCPRLFNSFLVSSLLRLQPHFLSDFLSFFHLKSCSQVWNQNSVWSPLSQQQETKSKSNTLYSFTKTTSMWSSSSWPFDTSLTRSSLIIIVVRQCLQYLLSGVSSFRKLLVCSAGFPTEKMTQRIRLFELSWSSSHVLIVQSTTSFSLPLEWMWMTLVCQQTNKLLQSHRVAVKVSSLDSSQWFCHSDWHPFHHQNPPSTLIIKVICSRKECNSKLPQRRHFCRDPFDNSFYPSSSTSSSTTTSKEYYLQETWSASTTRRKSYQLSSNKSTGIKERNTQHSFCQSSFSLALETQESCRLPFLESTNHLIQRRNKHKRIRNLISSLDQHLFSFLVMLLNQRDSESNRL